jgi:hypothetical protein
MCEKKEKRNLAPRVHTHDFLLWRGSLALDFLSCWRLWESCTRGQSMMNAAGGIIKRA